MQVTKATQAGRGNVPMLGHKRMPQKSGQPRLYSVPTLASGESGKRNVLSHDEEIFIPHRNCSYCGQQTRSWGSVDHGEGHVCSKECYEKYLRDKESKRVVWVKVKLVPGPNGHLWPEELLKKTQKQKGKE